MNHQKKYIIFNLLYLIKRERHSKCHPKKLHFLRREISSGLKTGLFRKILFLGISNDQGLTVLLL